MESYIVWEHCRGNLLVSESLVQEGICWDISITSVAWSSVYTSGPRGIEISHPEYIVLCNKFLPTVSVLGFLWLPGSLSHYSPAFINKDVIQAGASLWSSSLADTLSLKARDRSYLLLFILPTGLFNWSASNPFIFNVITNKAGFASAMLLFVFFIPYGVFWFVLLNYFPFCVNQIFSCVPF